MRTSREGMVSAARGIHVSSLMPTPASAMAAAFKMPKPASVHALASTMSRSRAMMELFWTPSSRMTTPPTKEDDGDGSQGLERH